jgi:hypothetical protein
MARNGRIRLLESIIVDMIQYYPMSVNQCTPSYQMTNERIFHNKIRSNPSIKTYRII